MTTFAPAGLRPSARSLCHWLFRAFAELVSVPLALVVQPAVQRLCLLLAAVGVQIHIGKRILYVADGLGTNGGFELSLTTFALVGLYGAWLVEAAVHPGTRDRRLKASYRSLLPPVLFLFIAFLSILVATSVEYAAAEAWDLTQMFLVLFYVACRLKHKDEIKLVFRSVAVILILEALLIIAQGVGVLGEFNLAGFKGAEAQFAGQNRPSGTFGAPNNAAGFLAAAGVMCFGYMLSGVRGKEKYLFGGAFLLAIPPLALTLSRGGWFGFLAGMIVLIVYMRKRLPWKMFSVVAACLVLAALPFVPSMAARLAEDDGSAQVRMGLNKLAFRMILDHPFLGVGINNFVTAMDPYRARGYSLEWVYAVHNVYLLVCAETGFFGLLAFVWIFVSATRQGLRHRNPSDSALGAWGVCCSAAIVTYLVQGALEPATVDAPAHLMWLIVGLVTALARIGEERQLKPAAISPVPFRS